MWQNRTSIGYIVRIDGGQICLNLLDQHRGQMAAHSYGVSCIADIGGLLAVDGGQKILIMKISSITFAEPREAHIFNQNKNKQMDEPLRNLSGTIIGWVGKEEKQLRFYPDGLITPALGAEVYPLNETETQVILGGKKPDGPITLGTEYRTNYPVRVGLNQLLAQHVAVLGSSGQGKSCFTAAIMQQLSEMPKSRIVIFDINGEYDRAFLKSEKAILEGDCACRFSSGIYKQTLIGNGVEETGSFRIPYYALGRQGLHRLLLPSEKTQRPALSFAVENLNRVEWKTREKGAALVGNSNAVLFDDCRQENADGAMDAIKKIRGKSSGKACEWPHMSAIAALVAESHCLVKKNNSVERNAFAYGNVAPLITRINRLIDDEMFRTIVDVNGGNYFQTSGELEWQKESDELVNRIFGTQSDTWRVHVVNLRQVPQDLMPIVLGSLLELYASVLFRRGQGNNPPTLLVLEEAHHYLRPISDNEDNYANALAYERLAKEGRKFGLSLWLSTQRPSEVSSTVLSQCNTWVAFRLNSEQDLKSISSACEWADPREVKRISGLPRQYAVVLGGSVATPTCIKAPCANPRPKSDDGQFDEWNNHNE